MKGFPITSKKVPECIKSYFNFREKLSINSGIVLKGQHRVIVPDKLRTQALTLLHNKAHLGLSKTLERARMCMFWPGITDKIKDAINAGKACLVHSDRQPKEPVMSDAITTPWTHLSVDN